MTKFEKQLNKLSKLYGEVNKLESEMTSDIENHLGDGWYITCDRGDWILIGSPDANNYQISTYFETISMNKDEAIKYIEERPFN